MASPGFCSAFAVLMAIAIGIIIADPYHKSPIYGLNFDPQTVQLQPLTGSEYQADGLDQLTGAELRHKGELFGPESLAFDSSGGGPYTGISDGRVVKWNGTAWETFALTAPNRTSDCDIKNPGPNLEFESICGRPLGLRFHPQTQELYIADAYFGLQVVGNEGGQGRVLTAEAEGEPFGFTNDLDIAKDGIIYFTDTSTKYRRRNFVVCVLELGCDGRLLKYDPVSKITTVLLRGLSFPNGVALSQDGSFVLYCESTLYRVQRYWLKGERAGTTEPFARLPGIPDNIRRNAKGDFWVGIHSRAKPLFGWVAKNPWARRALLSLPVDIRVIYVLFMSTPHGIIVQLDGTSGAIKQCLEDRKGKVVRAVSEVEEGPDGQLWMGSVVMPHIAVYKLPST